MRGNTAAVLHNHEITVAVRPAGKLDYAAQACSHWVAESSLYVEPGVKSRTARKRIAAITEAAA